MFKTLNAVALFLQVVGGITPIVGVLLAVASATAPSNSAALPIGLGGAVAGAILYCFGGSIRALIVVARNSQRTANALNRIAQRQTGVAEFIPDTKPKSPVR